MISSTCFVNLIVGGELQLLCLVVLKKKHMTSSCHISYHIMHSWNVGWAQLGKKRVERRRRQALVGGHTLL